MPFFKLTTDLPQSIITPADSWPKIKGLILLVYLSYSIKNPPQRRSAQKWTSLPQIPILVGWIKTSSSLIFGKSHAYLWNVSLSIK